MDGKSTDVPSRYSHDWVEKLDGRTTLSRVIHERLEALHSDLGGLESISYQERALCRRIVWAEAVLERNEAALARGEEINEGGHVQLVNSLVGLLKAIGLKRRTRPVPDLQSYLRERAAQDGGDTP